MKSAGGSGRMPISYTGQAVYIEMENKGDRKKISISPKPVLTGNLHKFSDEEATVNTGFVPPCCSLHGTIQIERKVESFVEWWFLENFLDSNKQ